jgi:septal ring factor EnvC (AmiA/AmiB activator)
LTQGVGQDEARKQVEQVRESLLGYYQQMRGSLEGQTREYLAAQATFDQQRFEFAEERQQLTNWFAARDEELRRGEERLQSAAVEASSHQNQWLSARDRWLLEKGEAEKLIRRLLASLGENNRDQSRSTDTTFHVHEHEGHSVPTTPAE